jgi:MYXO-CTERM domain-containing protein
MLFFLSAFAGPNTVLVGVDQVPPDLPGVHVTRCFTSSRVCLVEGSTPEALRAMPGVRHAAYDGPMVLAAGPSLTPTADCPDLHELESTGVEEAWLTAHGVDAPTVAVQDAGFRTSHEDLLGRIAGGYDHGDQDPNPEVTTGSGLVAEHGTFIAGIVAANDDTVGRVGVAPSGSLYLQKVADSSGALFYSYAIEAMDDLVLNHPEVGVLNYSIASTNPPPSFADAVSALVNGDILLVTAAANCPTPNCADADNDQYPVYPSSYTDDHVVSVASLVPGGDLDDYSHFGATSVDVAAPGGSVCSLDVDDDGAYVVASGTSYATPVVAGIAALVREAFPRLTAPEVRDVLCASSVDTAAVSGRVACGVVSAPDALAVPVVRFGEVPELHVEAVATWVVPVDSLAAATDATLQVELPEGLVLSGGSSVPLGLPSDEVFDVELVVSATEVVQGDAVLTLVLPDGSEEELVVAVTGVPTDTGDTGDTGETGDTGVDTAATADTGTPSTTDDTDDTDDTDGGTGAPTEPTDPYEGPSAGALSDEKGGCGCAAVGPSSGWTFAVGALLLGFRRRQSVGAWMRLA